MYSKGIMWLDDCRIPFVDGDSTTNHNTQPGSFVGSFGSSETIYKQNTEGRFTPNLLVCGDVLNDGKVSISEGGKTTRDTAHFGGGTFKMEGYGDKGTNSRYYDLDLWFDKMLERL